MITAASCYRLGDRYDDVIPNLDDENELIDTLGEAVWEEDELAALTRWAEFYEATSTTERLYKYACPPDFRLFAD